MRHPLIASLASASCILAMAPPAAEADEPPTRAQTEEALAQAQRVLDGQDLHTGRELTPLLARIAAGRSKLRGSDRREAQSLLARPTDGPADPFETGYEAGVTEEDPYCTAHFCVHYVATTADAPDLTDDPNDNDSVPESVETVAAEMEDTVRPRENGSAPGQLNWIEPQSDGNRGGGTAKTDVYLQQLGSTTPGEGSLYGYAGAEPATQSSQTAPAFLVLDDDFSPDEYGGQSAEKSRHATEAHEYNHVLQYAYDLYQDGWMGESTATWMEDQVYPEANDYVGYLGSSPRAWGACLATPLTFFSVAGGTCDNKVYGTAVFNHYLSGYYGPGVIRRTQQLSVGNGSFAVDAYEQAIQEFNGASFASEFELFANATAEWDKTKAPDAPFPDSYIDLPRVGTLTADGAAAASQRLDNTTFRLMSVTPDASKALFRLHADLPPGLSGGVGLVGRKPDGTIDGSFSEAAANGAADVQLADPGAYARITAVIANSDTRRAVDGNGDPVFDGLGEWVYAKNAQPFCNIRVTSNTTGTGTAAACPAPPQNPGTPANPANPANPATPAGSTAPPPASGAGTPPAQTTVTRALTFQLSVAKRQKEATVLKRGVSISLSCNQSCSARAALTLDRATAKRLKLGRTIGTASTSLSKAGKKTLRVKLSRKARAALRKRRGRVNAKLTLRTKGAQGTTKTVSRSIVITG